jgi:hypothetical protein
VRYVNNGKAQTLAINVKGMAAELAATVKVKKTPSWSRSWANFSCL